MDLTKQLEDFQKQFGDSHSELVQGIVALVSKFEVSLDKEKLTQEETKLHLKQSFNSFDETSRTQSEKLVNGYFTQSAISERASLLSKSTLSKHLAKRNDLWKDLLANEKFYFFQLVALSETFYKAFSRKKNDKAKILVAPKDTKAIFQDLESILGLAKSIYIALESGLKTWPDLEPHVGSMFMKKIKEIQVVYKAYVQGLSTAFKTYYRLRRTGPEFCHFVDEECPPFDLSGNNEVPLPLPVLLLVPLLRVSAYETAIRELYLHTPADHKDYADLTKAHEQLNQLVTDLQNDHKSNKSIAKVLNFVWKENPSLADWKIPFLNMLVEDLSRNPKNLVREGPINVVVRGHTAISCYLYLFSTVLLIAEVIGEGKFYYNHYSLSGAELIEELPTPYLQLVFTLVSKSGRRVSLTGMTQPEMRGYAFDIRSVIETLNQKQQQEEEPSVSDISGTTVNTKVHTTQKVRREKGPSEAHQFSFQNAIHAQRKEIDFSKFGKGVLVDAEQPIMQLAGPDENDKESPKIKNSSSARSVSLFPHLETLNTRAGGPISDRYLLSSSDSGRHVVVMADAHRKIPNKISYTNSDRNNFPVDPFEAARFTDSENIRRSSAQVSADSAMRCCLKELLARSSFKPEFVPPPSRAPVLAHLSSSSSFRGLPPHSHTHSLSQGGPSTPRSSASPRSHPSSSLLPHGSNPSTPRLAPSLSPSPPVEVRPLTTKAVAKILMNSVEAAHEALVLNKDQKNSSVSLLIGAAGKFESEHVVDEKDWYFCLASVGKCKAFAVSDNKITEVTAPVSGIFSVDTGGCIGPLSGLTPDLSGLQLQTISLRASSYIIVTSDGVTDNFDPENLGFTPKQLESLLTDEEKKSISLTAEWSTIDQKTGGLLKSRYTVALMTHLLSRVETTNVEDVPKYIVNILIQYCEDITRDVRALMQKNSPIRGVAPKNTGRVHGKLDHASVVCFRLG
eukprot:TRINITY_DN5030_c0_g1_i2.p1 TRINITY_DN5030_c0_g1~~TRINITY_DN5030_c0_g1_i2.p1  ORF type:complete len:960 (-),score=170.17 TRINITY_DN5030_c0_g1_i2:132-3011(-)